MKVGTNSFEVVCLSENTRQCTRQTGRETLFRGENFKYFRGPFTREGTQNKE